MIRISYSAPDEIEVAGTKGDFEALSAELQSFFFSSSKVAKIPADSDFDLTPYASRLEAIEFHRGSGPNCVSVVQAALRVSGSDENLALFGSWFDVERVTAPQHSHYEYCEGNQWVAPHSLHLVISLERDPPYNKAMKSDVE